ncbi:hypothetical protein A1O3_06183 [Capronia epimyces CBS 606.96]|uniref:Methyltransferase domain-containing protein n=1 Tax=Capronia epimyces CBS 606.96 TaxID=1182542 RepID=W9XYF2_9EURO|nr:uncharacterized protein A1O3_06183 [Capronia epimyces CBS 606.96]EXJ82370.1 hypothetical protein A1O3_06183 [Capronia epimyces CBS 606.96]
MAHTSPPQAVLWNNPDGSYYFINSENEVIDAATQLTSWAPPPQGFAEPYGLGLLRPREIHRSPASITGSTDSNVSGGTSVSGQMMMSPAGPAHVLSTCSERNSPPYLPREPSPTAASLLPPTQAVARFIYQVGWPPSQPFSIVHPLPTGFQDRPKLWDYARLRVPRDRLPSFGEFLAGKPALPDGIPDALPTDTFTGGNYRMFGAPGSHDMLPATSIPVTGSHGELSDAAASQPYPSPPTTADEAETVKLEGRSEEVLWTRPDEADIIVVGDRRYPARSRHRYSLPVCPPEEENPIQVRESGRWAQVTGKMLSSPFGPGRHQVLDLATGTGRWVLEMAYKHQQSRFIGTDIISLFPMSGLYDTRFLNEDVNGPWRWEKGYFDLIHMRDPMFVVQDWPCLVANIFTSVKPGGWVELSCTSLKPVMVQGPELSPPRYKDGFLELCDTLVAASKAYGTPMDCVAFFSQYLKDAGFVDVVEDIQQFPPEHNKQLARRFYSLVEKLYHSRPKDDSDPPFFSMAFDWTPKHSVDKMELFRKSSHRLFPHQSFMFEQCVCALF